MDKRNLVKILSEKSGQMDESALIRALFMGSDEIDQEALIETLSEGSSGADMDTLNKVLNERSKEWSVGVVSGELNLKNGEGTGSIMSLAATAAYSDNCMALGDATTAMGYNAMATGANSVAWANNAHAEGRATLASGASAHAEGMDTTASGNSAHAEGDRTTASAYSAHAEGVENKATKADAHVEGRYNEASGEHSHAEGFGTVASGWDSHSSGWGTMANTKASFACGAYNRALSGEGGDDYTAIPVNSDIFVIGNGKGYGYPPKDPPGEPDRSNCFRVTHDGRTYALSSFNSSGADYAEFFEWADGNRHNEDRVGKFVTLDGKKIKIASGDGYILGVVSGNPSIIGNSDEDWNGRWQRDEFGRFKVNNNQLVQNTDYDSSRQYISRRDRAEWDTIAMLGVTTAYDDGTCEVNGFCISNDDGTATKSNNGYRVIERIDDNIIRIVLN